jgi:hypothetical protein
MEAVFWKVRKCKMDGAGFINFAIITPVDFEVLLQRINCRTPSCSVFSPPAVMKSLLTVGLIEYAMRRWP